jgi:hypothetical protein
MISIVRIASTAVFVGFAGLGTVFAQSTWHVDGSAVPPGDGSAAHPYTNIQYAIDQATTLAGDTLLVRPGVYDGGVSMQAKGVSVRSSDGPLATRIRGRVQVVGWNGPIASVHGFWIDGPDASVSIVAGTLERCVVDGSEVTSPNSKGVFVEDLAVVRHCTIFGFHHGVMEFAFASMPSLIENSIVFGNESDAQFVYACPLGFDVISHSLIGTSSSVSTSCNPGVLLGVDPGYWSATDVHLGPLSVCIDAGDPSSPLDPDGSRADIGALPYDPNYGATPTTYCTPKTTSLGCAPLVTWTGSASLSGPDDFVLTAAPALNKKVGKFIWGTAPKALPFSGGTLCVKLPFVRGPHLNSGGSASGLDCSGAFTWHFSQAYMASKGITAGSILYAQAWGRDPGFADPNNSQLSDAIVFLVAH